MAQTSGMPQDEAWGWPCPYCRAPNSIDAVSCATCGAQLRDPDDNDLFTTIAADNAEIVPPAGHAGRESLWSTDANAEDDADEAELVDDGGLWDEAEEPYGAFSAEPSYRPDDVIDEPYHVDEPVEAPQSPGLFSRTEAAGRGPEGAQAFARSPFAAANAGGPEPGHPEPEPWTSDDPWQAGRPGWAAPPGPATAGPHQPGPAASPFAAPAYPPPNGTATGPGPSMGPAPAPPHAAYEPPREPAWGQPPAQAFAEPARPPVVEPPRAMPQIVPDSHGLSAAVGRLRVEDQEAAAVPISVCGALLQHDEVVLAAVTGQMLGHAAVVVLTTRRVLVVNARRWQPIVDVFDLAPDLIVRGRHDRDVAALTFADATRMSTVDGISEVALAVELAERVRSTE